MRQPGYERVTMHPRPEHAIYHRGSPMVADALVIASLGSEGYTVGRTTERIQPTYLTVASRTSIALLRLRTGEQTFI